MRSPRPRAGDSRTRAAPRVRLEAPSVRRQDDFLAAVRRSRRLHGAWVSPPATAAAFRAYLVRFRRPTHVAHWVCDATTGELVGVINLSEIVRGGFHSAYMGYYAFAPHHGRGLMREGLERAIDDAFRRLRLHRLEANIQPGNAPSIRLVKRLGFRREGYSPRYLKIAGRWRDHERWAILADDRPARRPRRRP